MQRARGDVLNKLALLVASATLTALVLASVLMTARYFQSRFDSLHVAIAGQLVAGTPDRKSVV